MVKFTAILVNLRVLIIDLWSFIKPNQNDYCIRKHIHDYAAMKQSHQSGTRCSQMIYYHGINMILMFVFMHHVWLMLIMDHHADQWLRLVTVDYAVVFLLPPLIPFHWAVSMPLIMHTRRTLYMSHAHQIGRDHLADLYELIEQIVVHQHEIGRARWFVYDIRGSHIRRDALIIVNWMYSSMFVICRLPKM